MAISSLGVGSGLDLSGMISSLMAVEQQPLIALQTKEASVQARISALGSLKSAISSLQTAAKTLIPSSGQTAPEKFTTLSASTGDPSLASATASSNAAVARYELKNIVLAKAEQVRKSDFAIPEAASDGSNDGTLSISVGGGAPTDIEVPGGATLSQIAQAINDADAGVTANIINDGTKDHLVISANKSGASNTISISASDKDGNPGTSLWSDFETSSSNANAWVKQQPATSTSVDINGLTVTSETNVISTAIAGVTITLNAESETGTTLTIAKNTTGNLTSALNGFISAFNSAATSMQSMGYYNASTKAAGALQGDATLRGAQSTVRQLLATTMGGPSPYQALSDIGVELQKDGTLKLNSNKLEAAAKADYTSVTNLVSTIGSSFKDKLEGLVGAKGNISAATESADRTIKELQKRQTALSSRLEQIQARYVKQFSALDTLVASMNQTSTYLTQQLANLPKINSSK